MTALENAHLERVYKPWGNELVINLDDNTVLKIISVADGYRTSLQRHEHKEEVIHVIRDRTWGGGVFNENGEWLARPGETVRITPGTVHRSCGPCLLLEASTNYPEDVVRIEDDFGRA